MWGALFSAAAPAAKTGFDTGAPDGIYSTTTLGGVNLIRNNNEPLIIAAVVIAVIFLVKK